MFIITDKVALIITIVIIYIILAALVLTDTIPFYYSHIMTFIGGVLLGGCYQAYVHDFTILKFGTDDRSVKFNNKLTVVKFASDKDEPRMNELNIGAPNDTPKYIFPKTLFSPTEIGEITTEFEKKIMPELLTAMQTQTAVTDRKNIIYIIDKSNFGPINNVPNNAKQLALLLIGDHYLIDNLNKYANRSYALIGRSVEYLYPGYIRLAIGAAFYQANPALDAKFIANLKLMTPKIDDFISKEKPPTSTSMLAMVKSLVSELPHDEKIVLIIAGMAYASDKIVDNYQAGKYTSVNDSGYKIAYYTSIVSNILNGVV